MPSFTPIGTCATSITFEIENGVITRCTFEDGCDGNLQAIARLIVNRSAQEVIALLEGIQCQNGTSCPDQLATALKEAINNDPAKK